MKIIRYKLNDDSLTKLGCVVENKVYNLVGDPLVNAEQGKYVASIRSVKLMAPCTPGKIIAMAMNYSSIGSNSTKSTEPLVFIKPSTCICGPGTTIVNPFPDSPMWGEPELAVVIRHVLRNATQLQVEEGILGFTIGNDMTVENVDSRDHHLSRSKCPDNFCPLGPWIDTDFDPSDCVIEGEQNSEIVRSGRSSEQLWQWPRILLWLSKWITLEPWDVILTGNPPDMEGEMSTNSPGMRYLQDGDIFSVRIKGLGELTNPISIKHTN